MIWPWSGTTVVCPCKTDIALLQASAKKQWKNKGLKETSNEERKTKLALTLRGIEPIIITYLSWIHNRFGKHFALKMEVFELRQHDPVDLNCVGNFQWKKEICTAIVGNCGIFHSGIHFSSPKFQMKLLNFIWKPCWIFPWTRGRLEPRLYPGWF